jgi:hypothetical protein
VLQSPTLISTTRSFRSSRQRRQGQRPLMLRRRRYRGQSYNTRIPTRWIFVSPPAVTKSDLVNELISCPLLRRRVIDVLGLLEAQQLFKE